MGEANPIQRLTQEPVTREGFLEEVTLGPDFPKDE